MHWHKPKPSDVIVDQWSSRWHVSYTHWLTVTTLQTTLSESIHRAWLGHIRPTHYKLFELTWRKLGVVIENFPVPLFRRLLLPLLLRGFGYTGTFTKSVLNLAFSHNSSSTSRVLSTSLPSHEPERNVEGFITHHNRCLHKLWQTTHTEHSSWHQSKQGETAEWSYQLKNMRTEAKLADEHKTSASFRYLRTTITALRLIKRWNISTSCSCTYSKVPRRRREIGSAPCKHKFASRFVEHQCTLTLCCESACDERRNSGSRTQCLLCEFRSFRFCKLRLYGSETLATCESAQ